MVQNIKFRSVRDHLQNKLKTVIRKINSSNKVLIFADKTRNLYKLHKDAYNKLLGENITKTYRKQTSNPQTLLTRS